MTELSKVVLLDDDPDIITIAQLCLEDFGGFEVVTFDRGQKFLDALGSLEFDLLLTDMMMPGLTGIEVVGSVKEEKAARGFVTVMMTAKAQSHEVKAYLEQGVDSVITKPFDPMVLVDQLTAIWADKKG